MKLFTVVTCCALVGACGSGDDSSINSDGGGPDASGEGPDASGPVVPGADPSFGAGGLVTVGFPGGIGGLMRVARQADGKVVGVGGTQESLLVMRVDGDGDLDGGFGDGGVVHLPWGVATNGVSVGYGCAIQDDGKIVIAARVLGSYAGLSSVGVVVRLLPDGSLDGSFAGGGYLVGPPGTSATSVALQDDGKILVGGYARLQRLLPDGTPDDSFGTGGTSNASNLLVEDLVVQPDGMIVTVGNRALARFTAAGAPDAGFGTAGVVTAPGTQGYDALYGVALEPDGQILAAGTMTVGGSTQSFWIGRYDPDGSPDLSFGTGGAVTSDPDSGGVAFGVAVDGDGLISASGYTTIAGSAGRSARFDDAGDPDPSFGAGGVGPAYPDVLFSNVALEPDGAITAAGAGFGSPDMIFAPVFARTGGDGQADASFGTGGEVKRAVGGSFDRGHAIAIQPDGKVLFGGWANSAIGGSAGLVRVEADGSLDPSFGDGGVLLLEADLLYVNAIAVAGDRILVSGLSGYGGDTRQLVVAAYDDAGAPDTSFGIDGVAAKEVFSGYDAISVNMAVGADGSIAAVGQTTTPGGPAEYAVLRLTAGGGADGSFDGDGAAATAFGAGYPIASHAAIDGDGGVLVLGQAGNVPALVRFDEAGAVDAGFGTAVPPGSTGMLPMGLAVQPDGKILVVAGSYYSGAMLVARYSATGELDAGFADGGVFTRTFAGNDYYGLYAFMGLVVRDDGGIVIGLAAAAGDALTERGLLLRLDAGGAPDQSYGPDGVVELALGDGSTSIHALAIDGEGRLLAVGRTWTARGGSDFMAVRFEAD